MKRRLVTELALNIHSELKHELNQSPHKAKLKFNLSSKHRRYMSSITAEEASIFQQGGFKPEEFLRSVGLKK